MLPSYALSFGVSLALVGLLISAFAVARVLLDIPAGMFWVPLRDEAIHAHRAGHHRHLLDRSPAFAVNYPMLLTARILEGVGSAMYTTISITAVSKLAPRDARGAHLSFYLCMFLLGTAFGPAVGGTAPSFSV